MVEPRLAPTTHLSSEPSAPTAPDGRRTDPSRDGLVGIYALRLLDRGVEPRALVAAHRSTRYGLASRPPHLLAAETQPPIVEVGRGAETGAEAIAVPVPGHRRLVTPQRARRLALPSTAGIGALLFGQRPAPAGVSRRLVTAGFAIAALLAIGAAGAFAEERPQDEQRAVISLPPR